MEDINKLYKMVKIVKKIDYDIFLDILQLGGSTLSERFKEKLLSSNKEELIKFKKKIEGLNNPEFKSVLTTIDSFLKILVSTDIILYILEYLKEKQILSGEDEVEEVEEVEVEVGVGEYITEEIDITDDVLQQYHQELSRNLTLDSYTSDKFNDKFTEITDISLEGPNPSVNEHFIELFTKYMSNNYSHNPYFKYPIRSDIQETLIAHFQQFAKLRGQFDYSNFLLSDDKLPLILPNSIYQLVVLVYTSLPAINDIARKYKISLKKFLKDRSIKKIEDDILKNEQIINNNKRKLDLFNIQQDDISHDLTLNKSNISDTKRKIDTDKGTCTTLNRKIGFKEKELNEILKEIETIQPTQPTQPTQQIQPTQPTQQIQPMEGKKKREKLIRLKGQSLQKKKELTDLTRQQKAILSDITTSQTKLKKLHEKKLKNDNKINEIKEKCKNINTEILNTESLLTDLNGDHKEFSKIKNALDTPNTHSPFLEEKLTDMINDTNEQITDSYIEYYYHELLYILYTYQKKLQIILHLKEIIKNDCEYLQYISKEKQELLNKKIPGLKSTFQELLNKLEIFNKNTDELTDPVHLDNLVEEIYKFLSFIFYERPFIIAGTEAIMGVLAVTNPQPIIESEVDSLMTDIALPNPESIIESKVNAFFDKRKHSIWIIRTKWGYEISILLESTKSTRTPEIIVISNYLLITKYRILYQLQLETGKESISPSSELIKCITGILGEEFKNLLLKEKFKKFQVLITKIRSIKASKLPFFRFKIKRIHSILKIIFFTYIYIKDHDEMRLFMLLMKIYFNILYSFIVNTLKNMFNNTSFTINTNFIKSLQDDTVLKIEEIFKFTKFFCDELGIRID